MPIIPRNTDPLKDYVTPGPTPGISSDGLVYNKIYAHTGVVDALPASNNTSPYNDPTISLINNSNYIQFNPATQTEWISSQDFGGPNSAPVVLNFYVSNTTYFNAINFNVLNVPCYVELLWSDGTPISDASTFVITGGPDINTTTDWVNIKYAATSTLSIQSGSYIQIRITRQNTVQRQSALTNTLVDIPYSIGVKNLSIRLNIQSYSDVPVSASGVPQPFVVQNKFGFIETYNEKVYSLSNALNNNSHSYWKSEPQPVGDAIVNFYMQVSDGVTITSLNRLYINPVYDGCRFNLYYTTNTGTDASQFTWTPVQRDFSLRSGIYEIPTVQCTYLKLEFVQLVPEIYDLPFDMVTKTINAFPYDVEEYFTGLESSIIDGNTKTYSFFGSNNNQQPIYTSTYSTMFGAANSVDASSWPAIGVLNSSTTGGTTNQMPNSSTQVIDPTISYKLIGTDGRYNNQTYTQFLQRKFPDTRVHNYTQITINQTWHQAYFVGLYYIAAFYENTSYDNIQPSLGSLISRNNNNTFAGQDNNSYIMLNPDDTATTPWVSTIDKFTGFSIAGLTTDWQSFLPDNQVLLKDTSNLIGSNITYPFNVVSNFGSTSNVIALSGTVSGSYSVQTGLYTLSSNIVNYLDANFLNGTSSWTALGSTTISNTTVTVWSGATSSGISVSGGQFSAAYNFTLPGVYSPSGTQAWMDQFGASPYAVAGFGGYAVPSSGLNYYFLNNIQVAGISGVPQVNTNLTMYTRFINPSTGQPIAGTTVTGTVATVTSGIGSNVVTATGGIWSSSIPSNTVQMVISGSGSPFSLFDLSVSTTPVTTWVSPSDRNSMRVSAVARVYLPSTNNGTYRISLMGTDYSGNITEITYKQFRSNSLPIGTWINIEVPGYSGNNYQSFSARISQTDSKVNEIMYMSMLSPFYHPVRYEYTTQSGSGNWKPIITGINNINSVVSTTSPGAAASGIQVRLTALDPNVFITSLSIVPRYTGNPYYISANIDYIGDSKTNELSSRTPASRKKLFLLNKEVYPTRFSIEQVANTTVSYVNM